MLNIQASNIGILSSADLIKNHPGFETLFKNSIFFNCFWSAFCLRMSNLSKKLNFGFSMGRQCWCAFGILYGNQCFKNWSQNNYWNTVFLNMLLLFFLTDLTRTGFRSLKGAATDGMNSIRRYLKQTYYDDEKQVSLFKQYHEFLLIFIFIFIIFFFLMTL